MTNRCAKCGREITVTLPRKKWYHAYTNRDLEHEGDTRTIDAVLMFMMNNKCTHNIWLCKECFAEWEKVCKWAKGTWGNNWEIWFKNKEVVLFT